MWRSLLPFVLTGLLLCAAAYFKFHHNHVNPPNTCDEFGYLQLAQDLELGTTWQQDPISWRPALVAKLYQERVPFSGYAWLVTPIAYHIDQPTGRIINQYPPGTSWLLKWLPFQSRQTGFAPLMVLLFLLIPTVVLVALYKSKPMALHLGLIGSLAVVFLALISAPLMTELTRINSLAPTFGLLLAAGIALEKKPGWAIVLVAVAINFRIASLVLLAPLAGYFLWCVYQDKQPFNEQLLRWGKIALLSLFAIAPYLIYTYLLLGNPFAPTYSEIDQRFADPGKIWAYFQFYFGADQKWMWFHVLLMVGIITLFMRKKMPGKMVVISTISVLFNYLFFMLHDVAIDYYPYATTLLLTGVIIATLSQLKAPAFVHHWGARILPLAALVLLGTSVFLSGPKNGSIQMGSIPFANCFASTDVVWANARTGTVNYTTDTPAFTYTWGNSGADEIAVNWLHEQGLQQAFWLDDLPISPEQLKQNLSNWGLPYEEVACEGVGKLLLIHPTGATLRTY